MRTRFTARTVEQGTKLGLSTVALLAAIVIVPSRGNAQTVSEKPQRDVAEQVTVVARDGAMFRGELVEKIPRKHVTLRLRTGEFRTVLWSDLTEVRTGSSAAAKSVPESVDESWVRFNADDRGAVLQKMSRRGQWVDVCYAPCRGDISAPALYRVSGSTIRESKTFRVPAGQRLHIRATTGDAGRWKAGSIVGSLGAVSAGAGLAVAFGKMGMSSMSHGGSQDGSDNLTAPAILFVGGAVVGVIGFTVMLSNRTKVNVESDVSARSNVHASNGPRLAIGEGLALTLNGLEF